MKKAMKKLIVLMLILPLVLPQALVLAEEAGDNAGGMTAAVTITQDMSIDKEAAKNLLSVLGLEGTKAKLAESAIVVLDALSSRIVAADNGVQFDLDLNGKNVISTGGELTQEGFMAVSTLFPNYVVTASMETIMAIVQRFMPAADTPAGEDESNSFGMDMGAVSEKMSAFVSRFTEACSRAVVPGEAEDADFTYEGNHFNTKIPLGLDVDAIVAAWKELVEQVLTDDDIRPLLDLSAQYSGGSFDPDSIREMNDQFLSEEYIPDVEVSIYVNRDEEGNESDIFCAVSEAAYKGASEPSYRYTFLSEGTYGDMKMEIPEAQTTVGFYYGTEEAGMNIHMDFEMGGQYYGFAADMVYGADTVVTLDLFAMDSEKPLLRDVITVSMNGERTLQPDTEGKSVLTMEEILSGGQEAMTGLISDIMTNGLSNLVISATKAMPKAGELISSLLGDVTFFGGSKGEDTAQDAAQDTARDAAQDTARDAEQDTAKDAAQEAQDIRVLQLGSSVYTIEIPDSYEEGERTDEDVKDDMVAYLYSPDTLLDFDVYQFSKEGYPETLADFTEQEAGEYNASEVVTDGNINGIDAAWYRAAESYDGQEYETVTYILDSGNEYVEIVFWLDGESAQQEVDQIMNSLTFVTR